jgi:hypothetical protein
MLIGSLFGWNITGVDVDFVSAVAAAAVGLASPVTSYLTAVAGHRHERKVRLYDDVRSAYTG